MTIGLGALAGLPPLAGFWSKEAILHAAVARRRRGARLAGVRRRRWSPCSSPPGTRPACGCGRSSARRARRRRRTRTSRPRPMRWPVLVLAVPSALLGFAGAVAGGFARAGSAPTGELVRRSGAEAVGSRWLLAALGWRRRLVALAARPAARPGPARSARCGPCSPTPSTSTPCRTPGRPAGDARWPGRCAAPTSRWSTAPSTATGRGPSGWAALAAGRTGPACPGRRPRCSAGALLLGLAAGALSGVRP